MTSVEEESADLEALFSSFVVYVKKFFCILANKNIITYVKFGHGHFSLALERVQAALVALAFHPQIQRERRVGSLCSTVRLEERLGPSKNQRAKVLF